MERLKRRRVPEGGGAVGGEVEIAKTPCSWFKSVSISDT
jgi:hypothetical protein